MGKETFIQKQNRCGFFQKKIELTVMHNRLTLYKPATNLLYRGVGQQTITESPRKFVPVRVFFYGGLSAIVLNVVCRFFLSTIKDYKCLTVCFV
jgi:hypothetical protein